MLRKHLLAIAFPGRFSRGSTSPDAAAAARTVTKHQMGRAFLDYIESRPEGSVPSAGGVPATVVVTMELETLMGGLKAASLDTGARISAGEARRIACRPGSSRSCWVGRRSCSMRVASAASTPRPSAIAMGVRDGGCTAAGCDAPPAFCHAHHDETPWSRDGGTSVAKGRLLCPKHHRLIHDAGLPALAGQAREGQVRPTDVRVTV